MSDLESSDAVRLDGARLAALEAASLISDATALLAAVVEKINDLQASLLTEPTEVSQCDLRQKL